MQDGQEPGSNQEMVINWRRFALLGSGVITGVVVIRLLADQIGIPRGTRASVLVSSVSSFLMYLTFGLATPHVLTGFKPQPLGRRLRVLVPVALVGAIINYVVLLDDL